MFFFGSLWNRWTLDFKIATPLLHCVFTVAQLHGSGVFWTMMKRQEKYIRDKENNVDRDVESAGSDGVTQQKEQFDTAEKKQGATLDEARDLQGIIPEERTPAPL